MKNTKIKLPSPFILAQIKLKRDRQYCLENNINFEQYRSEKRKKNQILNRIIYFSKGLENYDMEYKEKIKNRSLFEKILYLIRYKKEVYTSLNIENKNGYKNGFI